MHVHCTLLCAPGTGQVECTRGVVRVLLLTSVHNSGGKLFAYMFTKCSALFMSKQQYAQRSRRWWYVWCWCTGLVMYKCIEKQIASHSRIQENTREKLLGGLVIERTNEKRRSRYNLMDYIQWMHYTYFFVHENELPRSAIHFLFCVFFVFRFRSIFHNICHLYFMVLWLCELTGCLHQFTLEPFSFYFFLFGWALVELVITNLSRLIMCVGDFWICGCENNLLPLCVSPEVWWKQMEQERLFACRK